MDKPDLKPCPFCGWNALYSFKDGAVVCDQCQCEGPFAGHFTGTPKEQAETKLRAMHLWNARGEAAWEKASG